MNTSPAVPADQKENVPAHENGHSEKSPTTIGNRGNSEMSDEKDLRWWYHCSGGASPMDSVRQWQVDIAWCAKPKAEESATMEEMVGAYVAFLWLANNKCLQGMSAAKIAQRLGRSEDWFLERVHRWSRVCGHPVPDGKSEEGRQAMKAGMKDYHRRRRAASKTDALAAQTKGEPGRPKKLSVDDVVRTLGAGGLSNGELVAALVAGFNVGIRTANRWMAKAVEALVIEVRAGKYWPKPTTAASAVPCEILAQTPL